MHRHCFLLGLALGLLAPGVLHAQAPGRWYTADSAAEAGPFTGAPARQMYEDIEIMRRLLPRGLQPYQFASCTSCHVHPFGHLSSDGWQMRYNRLFSGRQNAGDDETRGCPDLGCAYWKE